MSQASDAPPPQPASSPPPRRGSGRGRLLLGLAIGALALGLALWGVPLREVGQAMAGASLPWLLPVAAIFMGQQVLRTWRQVIIIRALAPTSSFRTNFSILCISFLAINTLPARLGEIVRPLLLLEKEKIPLGTGFAVVFLERVVDLCATFVMLALVAWLVPIDLGTDGGHDWIALGRSAASALLPMVLIALIGLLLMGRRVVAWLRPLARRGPRAWQLAAGILLAFTGTFIQGLDALRSPARLFGIVAITALTWGGSVWMYPACAQALGIGSLVGYGEGLGVLSLTMIGGVIPAPPGMAGTYEAIVRAGLALYGVSGDAPPPAGSAPTLDAAAVAFALTMHWWVYLVQAVSAGWFLVVDRIDLRALLAEIRAGAWRDALVEGDGAPGGA